MYENFYVGAYWGPRQETALECARRADLFFQTLTPLHPSFVRWYRGGRGAPQGLPGHPVLPVASAWEQLFLGGRIRADQGEEFIERLGFTVHVWNGEKALTHVRLNCGGSSAWGPPNSCLLSPPEEGSVREEFLRAPFLAQVLTGMVSAWDPDYAVASSTEMVRQVQKHKGEVRVGWLTYLSCRLGTLVPLPAPVHIEPVGEQGWLLRLSAERMTASNPDHVAFTARVRELLERAGLIARPEPAPTSRG